MLKIGLIGHGTWGKKVAPEYEGIAKLEILDPAEGLFGDVESCDGIHVATPSQTHFDLAKKYLEMDKHVLVEKPMTMNSLEALKLIDIARERKLTLMVGHIFRYSDAMKKISKFINPSPTIYMQWKALSNQDHAIWDLAPHLFDMLNFFTGEWPVEMNSILSDDKKNAFVHGRIGRKIFNMELSLDYMGEKTRRINGIDVVKMQKNNTIQAEIEDFVRTIKKGRGSQTDGFLGYMVVKCIEDCLK
ncbi:MAG: Gfo/Idh/MocA family protein [Candidatus Helarchaeales archaeon]